MPSSTTSRRTIAAWCATCLVLFSFVGPVRSDSGQYVVGVVPSDDTTLRDPVARDRPVTAEQILDMVRRAVDLTGGMQAVVPAGAKLVLLKPNIGTQGDPRTGVNTDDRVVRAVAILVHEVAPEARILIAEGPGGWISPDKAHLAERGRSGGMLVDGFEKSGHRATVRELRAAGIDIDCFDLNFDAAYSLHPANGGLAAAEYSIAASIMDADVWINIPVAKTHGAKITCSLKNHFGILPGTVYGWSKANGTSRHAGMPHSPRQMDEAWVDLYGLTRVDFNVVDMITGSEAGPFEEDHQKRANIILAGVNPVAADLVAARLMGYNPDDFEFAELAWLQGLGPRYIDDVTTRGADLTRLVQRYKKAGISYGGWGEWAEHANYGMGPRYWTLLGPVARDHEMSQSQIDALAPRPGQDGWSDVVYFGSDHINLDKHFNDPTNCAVYAFTRFTMATSDSVRFWMGADEGLQVWLDGKLIHRNDRRRRHILGMDRIPGYVEAGEHSLLIRAEQGRGDFDFSINVCEPIDDELYAGNRYPGVRYYVEKKTDLTSQVQRVCADATGGDFLGSSIEANVTTLNALDPLEASRSAPDTVLLEGIPQTNTSELLGLLVQLSGIDPAGLHPAALQVMAEAPFTLAHLSFGREGYAPDYGPDISRLLSWLGTRYGISYGYGHRESLKTVHGWLAQGYVPVIGDLTPRRGRRWRGTGQPNWSAVTGFRQTGDVIELRTVRAGESSWTAVDSDWSGTLPGGLQANCPVIVVRAHGMPISADALADSIAGLALELGTTPEVRADGSEWGVPAGLTAWDWWVIDWERLPFTHEWAMEPETLDRLERLASRFPPELARRRGLAAAYFAAAAADATTSTRRKMLQQAADGYGQVADAMRRLAESMPQADDVAELTAADRQRLDNIAGARGLVRQARDGERLALSALASMLERPPLPPVFSDPLTRKDKGKRLFSWRAVTEDSVYELRFSGQDLQVTLVQGDEAADRSFQVFSAMPQKAGWMVAVEPAPSGSGSYRVAQQPAADNGWRTVIRVDDMRAWNRNNAPALTIWAVPGP